MSLRSAGEQGRSFEAYAKLVRLPNLFTAPPDIVLGAAIAASVGHSPSITTVANLSLAAVLLYAAGTTLNDYFDSTEDACERPERPIPSGDVSRSSALFLGGVLLCGGIVVAALTAGRVAGGVATMLAFLILLYDANRTWTSFLLMGGCRGMNVLLGTAAAVSPLALPLQSLSIPAVVTLYITGVTYMAESETGEREPLSVSAAMAGAAVAAAGVVGILLVQSVRIVDATVAVALLTGFVVWTGRSLRVAYLRPSPETIGPAVGTCVLGLVLLNAAFAAPAGFVWSLAAVTFLLPAVGLARTFDVS